MKYTIRFLLKVANKAKVCSDFVFVILRNLIYVLRTRTRGFAYNSNGSRTRLTEIPIQLTSK